MKDLKKVVVYAMSTDNALKVIKAFGKVKDVSVKVEKGLCDFTYDIIIQAPTIMVGNSITFSTYITVFGYDNNNPQCYGTVSIPDDSYLNILM